MRLIMFSSRIVLGFFFIGRCPENPGEVYRAIRANPLVLALETCGSLRHCHFNRKEKGTKELRLLVLPHQQLAGHRRTAFLDELTHGQNAIFQLAE